MTKKNRTSQAQKSMSQSKKISPDSIDEFSPSELARIFSVSPRTIKRMLDKKELTYIQHTERIRRVEAPVLYEYLRSRRVLNKRNRGKK